MIKFDTKFISFALVSETLLDILDDSVRYEL